MLVYTPLGVAYLIVCRNSPLGFCDYCVGNCLHGWNILDSMQTIMHHEVLIEVELFLITESHTQILAIKIPGVWSTLILAIGAINCFEYYGRHHTG